MAERLLNTLNANESTETEIIRVARALGLTVIKASFEDEHCDGMLQFETDDKVAIYVNIDSPFTRQRFTIAHEIGHYILHRNLLRAQGCSVAYRKQENNTIEQQANRFAAALLMPRNLVINEYRKTSNIKNIAKSFGVSTHAICVRLMQLGVA